MESAVFTQMSAADIRQLFREELQAYFASTKKDSAQANEPEDLLNIEQAGEIVNLKRSTIYRLIGKRAIPFSKQGKKVYFQKSELIAWVKSGRKKTNAEIAAEADAFLSSNRKSRKA